MARIAGINIPMNKHVWVGLTHIYGVGRTRSKEVCVLAGVSPTTKVKDLTETEVAHDSVLPCRSVIVMMVLLKDAWTCAIASSTFLRAFFGFLAAPAAFCCWLPLVFWSAICS